MKKPLIGIASCSTYMSDDNIFNDRYYILNNYIKPIIDAGGIPLGILYDEDTIIEENLDLFDGFLITGGTKIIKAHFSIIDYCVKNNKPFLGICMGMQALGVYSMYKEKSIESVYKNLLLIPDNKIHNIQNTTRNNKEVIAHLVEINQESKLFDILRKTNIEVNSLHKYNVKNVGEDYLISAKSEDGVIEAIEIKDKNKFIIGVEWHPELMPGMSNLFKEFIKFSKQ